jgi:pimeloyl-ACP methyl ester carboxylesterase
MTIAANYTPPLHYHCAGSGPDVLLVHGFASSGRMWDLMVHRLSHEFRFWAVDLCGFGESPLVDATLDMDCHVQHLIAFCEAKGIRPIVVAHSMGGLLALKMALLRPDLVQRLVLVAPLVTGRIGLNINNMVKWCSNETRVKLARHYWSLLQWEPVSLMSLIAHPGNLQAGVRVKEDFQRTRWAAAADALRSMCSSSVEADLHRIQQPTLVMVGRYDITVPPSEGRLAAAKIPGAQLVEFKWSRHEPLDEQPEAFLKAIRPFLIEMRLS